MNDDVGLDDVLEVPVRKIKRRDIRTAELKAERLLLEAVVEAARTIADDGSGIHLECCYAPSLARAIDRLDAWRARSPVKQGTK